MQALGHHPFFAGAHHPGRDAYRFGSADRFDGRVSVSQSFPYFIGRDFHLIMIPANA